MNVFLYLILGTSCCVFKFNIAQIPIAHLCEPTGKDFKFWGPTSECAERCHKNPKVLHTKPSCTFDKCFCQLPVIIKGFKFHNTSVRNKYLNIPMPEANAATGLDQDRFLQIMALIIIMFPVFFFVVFISNELSI